MTKKQGGTVIGLIIAFIIGSLVTWFMTKKKKQLATKLETWDMWEEDGRIKVEVHRRQEVE